MSTTSSDTPPYFRRHVFICTNQRSNGEASCADHSAQASFDYCKQRVKALGLAGAGQVRVNKAGCLDRCAGGPVMVIYPEGRWYTHVDQSDLDEIIERDLQRGEVVERLLLPPEVGR